MSMKPKVSVAFGGMPSRSSMPDSRLRTDSSAFWLSKGSSGSMRTATSSLGEARLKPVSEPAR